MKRILKLVLIFVLCFNLKIVYAEENTINTDEIISNQKQELGIIEFIKKSNEYTKDNLDGINIKEIFDSAITGRVGNTNIFNNVLNILGKEFKSTISTIRNNFNNNHNT